MDIGKLQTDIGQKIVSAAVANDVLALLALGIILDVKSGGGSREAFFKSVGWAAGKALVLLTVVFLAARLAKRFSAGRLSRPGKLQRAISKLKGSETLFAIVLVFVIAFASFSEFMGLDFVVGAFFGSMLLSHELLGRTNFEEIRKTASNVTMGFLGPVFFAAVGLQFDLWSLQRWRIVVAILAASFAGKILGGYLGGRLARLGSNESWALGVGLNGRGVMELVIANVALKNSFIGRQLFTTLVLMAVATTLTTPLLLKRAFDRIAAAESPARRQTRAKLAG